MRNEDDIYDEHKDRQFDEPVEYDMDPPYVAPPTLEERVKALTDLNASRSGRGGTVRLSRDNKTLGYLTPIGSEFHLKMRGDEEHWHTELLGVLALGRLV